VMLYYVYYENKQKRTWYVKERINPS